MTSREARRLGPIRTHYGTPKFGTLRCARELWGQLCRLGFETMSQEVSCATESTHPPAGVLSCRLPPCPHHSVYQLTSLMHESTVPKTCSWRLHVAVHLANQGHRLAAKILFPIACARSGGSTGSPTIRPHATRKHDRWNRFPADCAVWRPLPYRLSSARAHKWSSS